MFKRNSKKDLLGHIDFLEVELSRAQALNEALQSELDEYRKEEEQEQKFWEDFTEEITEELRSFSVIPGHRLCRQDRFAIKGCDECRAEFQKTLNRISSLDLR